MKVEDIELTPEEQAECDRLDAEYERRLDLGARCDLDCAAPTEKLMTGMAVHVTPKEVDQNIDRDALPRGAKIKQRFVEERKRIGFSFSVTRLDINVEKLVIAKKGGGTTLVAASLDDIGPPKSRVTWDFLASMTIMVGQYAMPMNRFAALASSSAKTFKAAEISRHFHFVAQRLCAVYLELGRALANADVLAGDDTSNRVIEMRKALTKREVDPAAEVPWASYATAEEARRTLARATVAPTLALSLAQELGFESERKDGKGAKRDFNTTVLSGRANSYDPRSTIVFYRSHLGGLGNILTKTLASRDVSRRDIVIQSDLSTVNLISDAALREHLSVKIAGCAAHARRPFSQYENDDPELCSWILHCFKGLSIYEYGLDCAGRNRDNTDAVRGDDVRIAWDDIKRVAGMISAKWSRETELGEGARYIIRHFERLTYYLQDHRLGPTNNFSERMLRLERLIENNALFRQTLEGRFALDIVRSVLQTAIAANVNLTLYLNWLLRMPADVVNADPAEFTPFAFAKVDSATP